MGAMPWLGRPRWFLAVTLAMMVSNTHTLQHTDTDRTRTGSTLLPGAANATFRIRLHRRASRAHRVPQSLLQLGVAARAKGPFRGPPPESIVGTVYAGLPPQELTVVFDSGSGNVILPAERCHTMACISHRSYNSAVSATKKTMAMPLRPRIGGVEAPLSSGDGNLHLSFATGTVVGSVVKDKVCLGANEELCTLTGLIEATKMSDEPFSLFPFDGIMGLGLPKASIAPSFNFLDNLAESQALASNRFAVWFAIEGDDEESEITFGDISEDRMESSNMVWLQLTSGATTGMWQTSMSDVAVGTVKMHLCAHGCQVAFDTGSGVIAGPSIQINAILAALNIAVNCANYESLPTLGFVFDSNVFSIDPADYIRKTSSGCYHQFLAYDLPGQTLVMLGAPFLRRYYTIYDSGSLQVGIAFAKHNGSTKPKETSAQAATRLMVQHGDPGAVPTGQPYNSFLSTGVGSNGHSDAVLSAAGEAATGQQYIDLLGEQSASEESSAASGCWLWLWC